MLKNYLLVAIRNMLKRKSYTSLNILGLALGMGICLLIVIYILAESGYDSFVPDGERIYRVVVDRKYPDRSTAYSNIPQSYAAAMQQEFPEAQHVVRVFNFSNGTGLSLRYNNKVFEGMECYLADSSFFDVFSHPFIAGNPKTALLNHGSLVITESTARTFFGDPLQAIGKQLEVAEGNKDLLEITGVISDWPAESHMKFDMLRTTAGLGFASETNYVNFGPHTYVKVREGTQAKAIEDKFPSIISKYAVTNIEQGFGISFAEFQKGGNGYHYYLQPLKDIYLNSHLEGELKANGSRQAIYVFSIIALVIFIIGCINFINLSTARSAERAKEVGLRKTFGSDRRFIIGQFLAESVLISLVSALLALIIALVMLNVFGQVTNRTFHPNDLLKPGILLVLLALSLVNGLLAGLYPAFILSSFKPIEVLKGRFKSGNAGLRLRNGLVVFQFGISIVLMVCTLVVNQQMQYMTGNNLGFNKELVLVLERADLLGDKTEAWRNEVKKITGVKEVSLSSALPGTNQYFGISWKRPESREPMTGRGMMADETYSETLGLELIQGRFFSKAFSTDTLSVILNEKAVSDLGLKNPVGSELVSSEEFINGPGGEIYRYKVVGVVSDFHYQSLHQPVHPLVISNLSKFGGIGNYCAIKIDGDNLPSNLAEIEEIWKKMVPEKTIQYKFLDQTIENQYRSEITTRRLFTLFSSLAIFVACIGLLGLAAYTTQVRTREIGIRKVLGASVTGIAQMLSRDFLKLVFIAILLAFPAAWYIMHNWLQDFTYRISIQPWVFIFAAIASVAIAMVTISFQTLKAALRNPVKTLQTE